ncbi:MAG: type IX secretion system sortase PorU [candidate division Zixibacteria bacterium]|nr:type IX secretion system sortase PorU [candidate division Zixibacteria bacterium]
MRRPFYILALLAILPVPSAHAGGYDDCTILEQSSAGITFSYRPGSIRWMESPEGDYPVVSHAAIDRSPGLPPVPGRVVYVALPPGSRTFEAQVISTGEPIRSPNPALASARHPSWTAASVGYPNSRLSVDPIFTMHGVRVARLVLHPLKIESAGGDVILATEMTVQVRYDHAATEGDVGFSPDARDPFIPVLSEVLINPKQGLAWQESDNPERTAAAQSPTDANPFANADRWFAIRTRGDGIVAFTPSDFFSVGVDPATLDPRQFRLFSGPGRQLSDRVTDPPPDFHAVAIRVAGEADGHLDAGDEMDFWADGLNRWEIDSTGRLADVVHRYDRDNVYWLAVDGAFPDPPKRIQTRSAPPQVGALEVFAAADRVRREDERVLRVGTLGYTENYYTRYAGNSPLPQKLDFATINPEPGDPARVEIASWAGFAGRDTARLVINDAPVRPEQVLPSVAEDRTTLTRFRLAPYDPAAGYVLSFTNVGATNYYLDYYSIEYTRRLDLSGGPQKFPAPDSGGALTFVIANATDAEVWDITDPATPVIQTDVARQGSVLRFGAQVAAGARPIYFAARATQKHHPQSVRVVTPVDLHTPGSAADYVAIGPEAFEPATRDFLDYRAGTDGLRTRYVSLEDVYASFSLGISDPVAIRRFLAYAFRHWPRPAPVYALLVGDGTNDFLDVTGAHSVNYVPPYIVPDDNAVTDESYVYFSDRAVLDADARGSDDPFPDMLIGRWPVKTQADVADITAKIKRYESADDLGDWRSRLMLVADDEYGERPNSVRENFHIRDAEAIARNSIPARIDINKIYLTEYPFDNPGCTDPNATVCTKSAARDAIVSGLNAGAVAFDYLGHGNKDQLAHEKVFDRTTDLGRLTNDRTPTALLTFSCSIGFFDDPNGEGLSEELLRMPQGGVVAAVSATRVAAALANAELNEEVFDLLFKRGMTRIAAALYTGKLVRQYFPSLCGSIAPCTDLPCPCENDRGYILFGDPAMRLGIPTQQVRFTSVAPDSLSALSLTHVEGDIVDTSGSVRTDFDGSLSVIVRDAPRHRIHPLEDVPAIEYDLPGGTLYRGQVAVAHGRFAFGFIVPKDIAYGQRGARIQGHATSPSQMAGGAIDSLLLAGTSATVLDTTGPDVHLETAAGEPVVDGFRLAANVGLVAIVHDTSGVNLTGAPGHRLLVSLAGQDHPLVDLTDNFVYDAGAADQGRARFGLEGVGHGPLRLLIKAWDNANNSSVLAVDLEITDPQEAGQFQLTEFLNYPNPFRDQTHFYFRATRAVTEATIRIFTLAGHLIWEANGVKDGDLAWDGRDAVGDAVANGVYLAQIEAKGEILSPEGDKADHTAYKEIKLVVSR